MSLDVSGSVTTGEAAAGCERCLGKFEAAKHVLKSLADMRKDEELCDLVLEVGASHFRVHRLVLCIWSPVLRALLLCPESQTRSAVGFHRVQVGYSDAGVFEQFVNYLYTGDVPERAVNVPAVLLLAASFKVIQLQQYCEELLKSTLNVENMISIHRLAIKFGLKGLEIACLDFLRKYATDIAQTNEFRELIPEEINAFLGSASMRSMDPEIKLFLIISWLTEEVAVRQQYLVVLLSHIDWSVVAADFLAEISQTDNFFTCNPASLYLLLQTLRSSSISLGPYESQFEDLKKEHSYLLTSVVSSSVALGPGQPRHFQPVSIRVTSASQAVTGEQSTSSQSQRKLPSLKTGKEVGISDAGTINRFSPGVKDNMRGGHNPESIDISEAVSPSPYTAVHSNDSSPQGFLSAETDGTRKTASSVSPLPDFQSADDGNVRRKSLRPRKQALEESKPPKKSKKTGNPVSGKKNMSKLGKAPNLKVSSKKAEKETKDIPQLKKPVRKSQHKSKEVQLKRKGSVLDKEMEEKRLKTEVSPAEQCDGPSEKIEKIEDRQMTGDYKEALTVLKEPPPKSEKTKKANHKVSPVKLYENNSLLACDLCSFTTKVDLKYYRHLASNHFPGPPHRCGEPECPFSAPCIKELAKHRTQHGDLRPFVCTICLMAFRAKNNLYTHAKVHSDERQFKCPKCDKAFKLKSILDQHMVIHSDLRPYLCDLCGFSTKFHSHLIAHKRTHTGEVFHCKFPSCVYSTPKRSQLKYHMRSHLGIRTHVCSTCGKAFVEKSHLVRHERIHSADRSFACSDCSYTSTRLDKLKEHRQKHHGSEAKKAKTTSKESTAGCEGTAEATLASKKRKAGAGRKGTAQDQGAALDNGEGSRGQELMGKGEIVEVVVMKRDNRAATKSTPSKRSYPEVRDVNPMQAPLSKAYPLQLQDFPTSSVEMNNAQSAVSGGHFSAKSGKPQGSYAYKEEYISGALAAGNPAVHPYTYNASIGSASLNSAKHFFTSKGASHHTLQRDNNHADARYVSSSPKRAVHVLQGNNHYSEQQAGQTPIPQVLRQPSSNATDPNSNHRLASQNNHGLIFYSSTGDAQSHPVHESFRAQTEKPPPEGQFQYLFHPSSQPQTQAFPHHPQ